MPDATELQQSTEETTESLERLVSILDDTFSQFEDVCSDIEAEQESFSRSGEVATQLDALSQAIQESEGTLETVKTEITEAIATLEQTITDASEGLDTATQALEEINTGFEEIATASSEFEGDLTEVETAFNQIVDTVTQVENELTEAIASTQKAFDDFEQQTTELQQEVESFSELEPEYEELTNNVVAETHSGEIETGFNQLSEQLTQEQSTEMTTCFDDTETHITEFFETFKTELEENADRYQQDAPQALTDLSEECENTFKADFANAANEVTDGTAGEFMNEMTEVETLMNSAQEATAELEPIVEELQRAETTTVAINTAVEEIAIG